MGEPSTSISDPRVTGLPDTLSGRRALVTAGSRGIGRAVAAELTARGARVVITGTGPTVADTAAELGAAGWTTADFSEAGQATRAAGEAAERLGGIDILVANTGGPRPAAFLELTEQDWASAYQLILGSAIELSRACLPAMLERGWGRLVYLTSTAGVVRPTARLHLSNTMRAGVAGLSQSIALEAGAGGVTTNVIATGPIETDRHRQLFEARAGADGRAAHELAAEAQAQIPVRRFGRPDELAALVGFLCSTQADFITGAEHVIDGGASLT